MDNYSDSLDAVAELEESFRQAAIKATLIVEPTPIDFDGKYCYDCDIPIPKARLDLGKFRCVDCQDHKERNQRMFRSLV